MRKHTRCSFLRFSNFLCFSNFLFNLGHLVSCLGYVEALVIPAGARRIKVVEEKPAHSYLGKHCVTFSVNVLFCSTLKCAS